jgi:hypothetical protein
MVSAQDKPSRQRMGEERIAALLQESLAVAVKTDAMKPQARAASLSTPRFSRRT